MQRKSLPILLLTVLLMASWPATSPILAQEIWTDDEPVAQTVADVEAASAEEEAEEEVPAIDPESVEAILGPYRIPSTGTLAELGLKQGKLIFDLPEVDSLDLTPTLSTPSGEESDEEGTPGGEGGEVAPSTAAAAPVDDDPNRWHVKGKPEASVVFQIDGENVTALLERPEGNLELIRDDGLIVFDLTFEDEEGSAPVRGMAGNFEYQEGEYLLATDGVRLRYRRTEINAQTIRVEIASNELTAEGNIWVEEKNQYLAGDTLALNLDDGTGKLSNAWGRTEPEFFFTGREIARIGEQTFTIVDGTITSCTDEVPDWSFALGEATITVGEYAHIRNARMKIKNTPIFWVPRMVWPATTERTSGFLIPKPTYSNRRGAGISTAYYKTLGRSADATFYADATTEGFWAIGSEFRYRPSVNTTGLFEGLFQFEPDLALDELYPSGLPAASDIPTGIPDEERWKIKYYHSTENLWGGWRGVVDIEDYSDPVFRLDLERSVRRQTNSFIYSRAYLTRNMGQHSFNFMVDQRERVRVQRTIFEGRDELVRTGRITDTRRQLPEMEYRLRPTKLGGTPIYFGLDASVSYLSIERTNNAGTRVLRDGDYGRADLFPNLSIPLSTLPWLSAKLDVGARGTYYTNSIDPGTNDFFESDRSIDRSFGIGGLEIVGPSVSRIFEKKNPEGSRFSKYKHIIEPRIDYVYRDDFDSLADGELAEEEIPLFDEVDDFQRRNQATFSVINRLLAKPTDESKGGGFEIASFELSMPYSFDEALQIGDPDMDGIDEEKKDGPIRATFRFNPTDKTSLKADARYGTLFNQLRSLSVSGNTRIGEQGFGISLFTNWNNQGETVSNQARFTASFKLTQRFSFDAAMSFDLEDEEVKNPLQQRYVLRYNGCCYGWMFEFRESNFGDIKDRDFLLSFSLKNVGSFIDLRGSMN